MKKFALAILLLVLWCRTSVAMFAPVGFMPLERLVTNAQARAALNPNDAETLYTLGRIHYIAFAEQTSLIPVNDIGRDGQTIRIAPDWRFRTYFQRIVPTNAPPPPTGSELVVHAEKAAESFRAAIKLDNKNPLYHLGLASLMEQFASFVVTKWPESVPDNIKYFSRDSACAEYLCAFDLAIRSDSTLDTLPIEGLPGIISHEAGEAFLRLAPEFDKRRADVATSVAKIKKLKYGMITPVIVAMNPVDGIDDLLSPSAAVKFDLSGFNSTSTWSWLKPDTGLLVWQSDPQVTITSGQQLFGNYTFRIFWRDGYAALRSLDDNGDGWLRSTELLGIAVWFDRNQNGRCDEGEVESLESLGIDALNVEADSRDGIHPRSSAGVHFRDGRSLPTWDWITSPSPSR